jgi:Entner-Doudoroff aldolase
VWRDETGDHEGIDSSHAPLQAAFEDRLADAEIIAILRGLTPEATTSLALELRALDVRFIEVTIQDEQGALALRRTVDEWPAGPHMIGAGSIISAALARQAIDDGAEFLVSPGLSSDVVGVARDCGVPILPGVATPSEVQLAAALGLTAVKEFPAAQLGGPAYLRALGGPFPSMKFVPTGGVDFENAQAYLAAGALAVGIGGQLTKPSGLESLRRWIDRRSR